MPVVVDINPKRQGMFLPKTAQEVVSPEYVAAHRSDIVLATNRAFATEIRGQVEAMGTECEFHVL